MSITYRTRRRLKRVGTVALLLLLVAIFAWLCWVIWVERYIVYTRDGATIDFSLSQSVFGGEEAYPPAIGEGPEIYYNEGENAVNVSTELTQITGFYISADMLANELENVKQWVAALPADTPVMIDLKGGYGSFYYSSELSDAIISQSMNVQAVDELIQLMKSKNLYMIARIPAFQDYTYALNHVSSGIPFTGGGGALWMDNSGCYWLKPTDSGTLGWITSIVLELRGLGFDEVVLDGFQVPDGKRVVYNGDKQADLVSAAEKLIKNCTTDYFTLSFATGSATFPLPEGRSRLYVGGLSARDAVIAASQTTVPDATINLVFLADTSDTRFNEYSVLRAIHLAPEIQQNNP